MDDNEAWNIFAEAAEKAAGRWLPFSVRYKVAVVAIAVLREHNQTGTLVEWPSS